MEFAQDAPTSLGEMWIWDYHEYIPGSGIHNRALGCRQVTIQHSMTGSGNPADWTTGFTGEIPKTPAVAEAPVSLVVDFQGAPAKYIVMTTGSGSSRNWSAGALVEVALSEVGFSPHVITASFFPAVIPNVVEMTFTGENERDDRLEYVTDSLQQNWTFSGLVLHYAGGTMTVFDPGWASSFKIYRLVLE